MSLFRKPLASPITCFSNRESFARQWANSANCWNMCARSDTHLYLIAEVDGEMAGMLHFQPGKRKRNAHAGEFGISVRKKYWGMSIGRQLLQALLQWARQTGKIRKINLRVRTDNERAIRLYRSVGFKVEGTISREFCIDGRFYDAHWMGIELD